jgi:hypothetical protein
VIALQTRLVVAGLVLAAIVSLALLWRHEHRQAVQARSERDAAVASVQMREAEVKTVERYHETERVIRETADPIIQTIEESAGSDTALPDDVLASWRSGINSLRDETGAADNSDPKPAG